MISAKKEKQKQYVHGQGLKKHKGVILGSLIKNSFK